MRSTCASGSAGFKPANGCGGPQLWVSWRYAWKCRPTSTAMPQMQKMAEDTGPCNPVLGSQGLGARCLELEINEVYRNQDFPLRFAFHVVRASGRGLQATGNSGWVCGIAASPAGFAQHPGSRRHPKSFAELWWLRAGHVHVHRAPVAALRKFASATLRTPCALHTRTRRTFSSPLFQNHREEDTWFLLRAEPAQSSSRAEPCRCCTPAHAASFAHRASGTWFSQRRRRDIVASGPLGPGHRVFPLG